MTDSDQFDTSLLGLKYVLIDFLGDHDIRWFEDFDDVDVDISNGELKVYLRCDWAKVAEAIQAFASQNNFPRVFFSPEKGAVTLRRKAS